jgi:hypothetical protein
MTPHDRSIALIKIKRATFSLENGNISPRTFLGGLMAGFLACGLLPVGASLQLELSNFSFIYFAAAYIISVVAAFSLFMRFSKQPTSWESYLDDCLAKYEPASMELFISLQDAIKAKKGWDTELLRNWAEKELEAIKALELASQPPLESKFLSRRVQ